MSKEPNRMSTQDDPGIFFGEPIKILSGPDVVIFDWPKIPDADSGIAAIASQLNLAGMPTWKNLRTAPIYFTNSISPGTATFSFREELPKDNLSVDTARRDALNIKVADNISVTDGIDFPSGVAESSRPSTPANPRVEVSLTGSEVRAELGNVAPLQEPNWVEQLSWLLPKEIGEAILGDLLEKRERMAAKGCSPRRIECFSVGQIILSIGYRVLRKLGWLAMFYSRITEWLSPNR